jgi:hypothetical protein
MVFKEEYSQSDLEAAIEHGIGNLDAATVRFLNYTETSDHIQLIESMGIPPSRLYRYPLGFAIGKNNSEVLALLSKVNETDLDYWSNLLEGFYGKKIPPVIVINKKLCDGVHRSVLCYLFNVPVKIANFKADEL